MRQQSLLDPHFLQATEEGFRDGIVPKVALPAHAWLEIERAAEPTPSIAAEKILLRLAVHEVLRFLDNQRAPFASADVVERNPDRDNHGMTAVVAAKFVKKLAAYAFSRT